MTLENLSDIPADLILDMRTENEAPECPDGIGCLAITPIDKEEDESILKSIH